MNSDTCRQSLLEQLGGVPLIDAHTHLVGGKLSARGLHDILLYHMSISDLYAAGCPTGARLTQYPGWPSKQEAHARIQEALPHLACARNTSTHWGIRMILRDLYGWTEDIREDNWRKLDDLIRERADDRAWHRQILQRAGIQRTCTEIARREDGSDDDILDYALEWAFLTRCQWGEFDTALYELERCWGRVPESPTPIGAGGRPPTDRAIGTLEDAHAAVKWYVDHIPTARIISMATHISTDLDLRVVSDQEMAAALGRRSSARAAERDIYASWLNEAFLNEFEAKCANQVAFQFSFGAEPLPCETASRLSQRAIAQVAEMIGRHPGIRFQCFLSSMHANQSLCTMCRELPNLALAGYWWHNFFPAFISQVMEERLDMLPLNRQIGFFSDAYVVEWAYAKAGIVRAVLADVLARKVARGQYDLHTAVSIAREILFETARTAGRCLPDEGLPMRRP
jgi:glucuronate isomerase